jgi:predicted secreted protein
MKKLILFLLLLATFSLLSCKETDIISKDQNGNIIPIHFDTDFEIALKSNPSTGFSWEITDIDSSKIHFKERYFTSEDTLPGASGIEHIVFKAIQKGKSSLKLGYLRSWEGKGSMMDSFSVIIKVH